MIPEMKNGPSATTLTVQNFLSWKKARAADLLRLEEELQCEAEHTTVTFVVREMGKGLSLQDAGNLLVRYFKYNRPPIAFIRAARKALEQMGWQQPPPRHSRQGGEER